MRMAAPRQNDGETELTVLQNIGGDRRTGGCGEPDGESLDAKRKPTALVARKAALWAARLPWGPRLSLTAPQHAEASVQVGMSGRALESQGDHALPHCRADDAASLQPLTSRPCRSARCGVCCRQRDADLGGWRMKPDGKPVCHQRAERPDSAAAWHIDRSEPQSGAIS